MMNPKTGKVVPRTDPMMVAIDRVWDNDTTYAQRKAYIEVTLHNSRNPAEMRLWQEVNAMMQKALNEME